MTRMIEVKTAELEGAALDWAVAKALGGERKPYRFASNEDAPMDMAWVFQDRYACTRWSPSTDWNQGGPLIAKHGKTMGLELRIAENSASFQQAGLRIGYTANDVLIAVCRAVVGFVFGDTVQVPAELIGGAHAT